MTILGQGILSLKGWSIHFLRRRGSPPIRQIPLLGFCLRMKKDNLVSIITDCQHLNCQMVKLLWSHMRLRPITNWIFMSIINPLFILSQDILHLGRWHHLKPPCMMAVGESPML